MSERKLLNIGCGRHFHPDWINLDVAPSDSRVLKVDISRGLPFAPEFADACYSSHVLEHLDRAAAQSLIAECFRILNKGGVIRVVVPDLEAVVREYLRLLESVASGESARQSDYDWIMLELYDQTVRDHSGGEMAPFLSRLEPDDRHFVRSRIGVEADSFWSQQGSASAALWKKTARNWRAIAGRLRRAAAGLMVHILAGSDALRSFHSGIFRSSGEVHLWMYDRYSLRRLLEQFGFENVRICKAEESRIPGFAKYSLDVIDGSPRKPDSLYMEASKPQ